MIKQIEEVLKGASEIVKEGFLSNFELEYKSGKSNIVTSIDKKSEQFIFNYISKNFPSHGILAEEGSNKESTSEYTWVVDPIDGTTNFAHGLPLFSVSIGILRGNEIVAGGISDVMSDTIYLAEVGSGSTRNGVKIKVSNRKTIDESLLVTGFPYNVKENPGNAFEIFSFITKNARAVRRLGSAALDFCYVANGVFDAFWEINLQPWDVCAGILLVKEAGGNISDYSNNKTTIYGKQVIASNGLIHNELQNLIFQKFDAPFGKNG